MSFCPHSMQVWLTFSLKGLSIYLNTEPSHPASSASSLHHQGFLNTFLFPLHWKHELRIVLWLVAEVSDKWVEAQCWSLKAETCMEPAIHEPLLKLHCGPSRAGIVNYILQRLHARKRNQNYCFECRLNPWGFFQEYGTWALSSGNLLIFITHFPTKPLASAHLHSDDGWKCSALKRENRLSNQKGSNLALPFGSSVTLIKSLHFLELQYPPLKTRMMGPSLQHWWEGPSMALTIYLDLTAQILLTE